MNKNEIVNALCEKILANDKLTADLYTIESILNPIVPGPFADDLPPEESDPAEDLKENIDSTSRDYRVRASEIKKFVRTEIDSMSAASPLEIIDAYNEIVSNLEADCTYLAQSAVKYPRTGLYKIDLKNAILKI